MRIPSPSCRRRPTATKIPRAMPPRPEISLPSALSTQRRFSDGSAAASLPVRHTRAAELKEVRGRQPDLAGAIQESRLDGDSKYLAGG